LILPYVPFPPVPRYQGWITSRRWSIRALALVAGRSPSRPASAFAGGAGAGPLRLSCSSVASAAFPAVRWSSATSAGVHCRPACRGVVLCPTIGRSESPDKPSCCGAGPLGAGAASPSFSAASLTAAMIVPRSGGREHPDRAPSAASERPLAQEYPRRTKHGRHPLVVPAKRDGPCWTRTSDLGIKSPGGTATTNRGTLKVAATSTGRECSKPQRDAVGGDGARTLNGTRKRRPRRQRASDSLRRRISLVLGVVSLLTRLRRWTGATSSAAWHSAACPPEARR
jgi:hypothetical protein